MCRRVTVTLIEYVSEDVESVYLEGTLAYLKHPDYFHANKSERSLYGLAA